MTVLVEAFEVLEAQTQKGIRKYGGTLDTTEPGHDAILDHAIQEAADLLLYLIALRKADKET